MEPFIRETATKLIDRFINDGQAEIISQFAYLLASQQAPREAGGKEAFRVFAIETSKQTTTY